MNKLSVVAITDSLGLDRARHQPELDPEVSYLSILENRLSEFYEIEFYALAQTGRTVLLALNEQNKMSKTPDIQILQVGIVDCAPRLLGNKMRLLVGLIKPNVLQQWVIKLLGKLHTRFVFKSFGHRLMVSPSQFEKGLHKFVETAFLGGSKHVFIANILPTTTDKEYIYVGFTRNIEKYNKIIENVASQYPKVYLVDFYNPFVAVKDELTFDGVHPFANYKMVMANILTEEIIKSQNF